MKRFIVIASVICHVVFAGFSSVNAADKVVVIPLSTQVHGERELFLSASNFRPTTSMLAWSWRADGAMIEPGGASHWVAPIPLPSGTTIVSLELYWKNVDTYSGISRVSLYVFSLVNGNGIAAYNMSSSVADLGVRTVKKDAINFQISDTLKPSVNVYLSNSDRWLMGVKVVYRY